MQSTSPSKLTLAVVLAFALGCLCGGAAFGLLRPVKILPGAEPADRLVGNNALQGSDPTALENGPKSLVRAPTANELDGLTAQRELAAPVEAGQGLGLLSGTVRGLAGEPLSGVRLVAASAVLSRVEGAGQIGSGVFDPRSTWLAQRSQRIPSGGTEALTDAQGHFEIAVQERQLYQLSAHLAGWILQPLAGSADAVSAGQKLDFRGQPAAQLVLDLVDEQGQPLQEATLGLCSALEYGTPWSYLEWRRASPAIDLPRGSEASVLIEAGLLSGDLLLDLDGQPLTRHLMQETRNSAHREPERQLTVGYQRGGSRSTVRVPASALFAGGFAGAKLVPNLRP